MIKCIKFLILLSILLLKKYAEAKPQELQDAALLAFAQAKDTFDNGAAAKDTKEFEFFGAKVKNDMAIGFGDAMKTKRSTEDSSSSSSESEERRKRSASFENHSDHIINSNEKVMRKKRLTDDDANETNYIEVDDDDYNYDYSSYSYSDSEEVEEGEAELSRAKRNWLTSSELQRLQRSDM